MNKSTGDFIDRTIEDPRMREFDWHVALYTFVGNLTKVIEAKWRRASYIQKG